VVHSKVHISTQTLRLHLVDICRITQRCVDYAIRAFQEGNPDLIAGARDSAYEIQILHFDTTEIAHDLLLMEVMSRGEDLRFVLSSIRICDALHAIHNNAVEIASNTMRFWGNGGKVELTDFPWIGDGVNRLVECCAVSLMDENTDPAYIVLSTEGLGRELVNMFHDWYGSMENTERAQARHVFAIARNLSQIVHQAREMADALVFWLGDENRGSFADPSGIKLIDDLTPVSVRALEAAISRTALAEGAF
jgi:phosphate uptake regulator